MAYIPDDFLGASHRQGHGSLQRVRRLGLYGDDIMRHVHESSIAPKRVIGTKGWVDVFDVLTDPLTIGIRVIPPKSDIPTHKHAHTEAQITYVVSGSPKITNLQVTLQLKPGDFVILEPNEEHYVMTDKNEARLLEVKFKKNPNPT
jgi:quercetin dioxygenase-like cupin family protein